MTDLKPKLGGICGFIYWISWTVFKETLKNQYDLERYNFIMIHVLQHILKADLSWLILERQDSRVVKPRFCPCHELSLWLWCSFRTSLRTTFYTYKGWIVIALTLQGGGFKGQSIEYQWMVAAVQKTSNGHCLICRRVNMVWRCYQAWWIYVITHLSKP